jgi:hypothetical protein
MTFIAKNHAEIKSYQLFAYQETSVSATSTLWKKVCFYTFTIYVKILMILLTMSSYTRLTYRPITAHLNNGHK